MNLKYVREVGGTSAYSRKKSGNKYNYNSLGEYLHTSQKPNVKSR